LKRKIVIATMILVGAVFLARTLTGSGGDNEKWETVDVVRADLILKVEATGALESTNSKIISPPRIPDSWRYTISFMAPEGKEVKKGTPILGFDSKKQSDQLTMVRSSLASDNKQTEIIKLEEQEKLEQAVLDLAELKVELSKVKRKLDRPGDLVTRNELQQQRLDAELLEAKTATAERKLAHQKESMKSRLKAHERKIARAKLRESRFADAIERMTVKAPKDGLLIYKTKWNGDKYAVGENVWQGSSLMEIPDLGGMRVAGIVAEPDAGKVAVGQAVEIRLDANPDKLFKGEIQHLGRIFRRKSHQKPSIVFDAVISINNPDPELMRPGMATQLMIITDRLPGVLQIPQKAVHLGDEGHFVRVLADWGKVRRQVITPGRHSGDMLEVLDGLKEGERVLLSTPEDS